MNKRSCLQPRKRPVTYWRSRVRDTAEAPFREFSSNVFDEDGINVGSLVSNHGGGRQATLVPIRIPIGQ
jgi:hypothetical protein